MEQDLILHMDHFSTFPDTDNLDTYLKENYEDLGFIISDKEIKQNPGINSRFVLLTGEYFEFNIVKDREAFKEAKKPFKELVEVEKEHRPYAIGYVAEDIEEMYEHWRVRGFQVEDVMYIMPRDADPEIEPQQDPTWTYIPFPSTFAQGVKSYVIQYMKRKPESRFKFVMGENGIYGVNGITLVTNYPHNRGEDWSNFFYSKNYHTPFLNECLMDLPPHFIQWITPQKFSMIYKKDFIPSKTRIGELYVIHLLTKDLNYTKEYFQKKGKNILERSLRLGSNRLDSILLERNKNDGFLFAISERDPEEWLNWRKKIVNEQFK
jgi:hypothetical protein